MTVGAAWPRAAQAVDRIVRNATLMGENANPRMGELRYVVDDNGLTSNSRVTSRIAAGTGSMISVEN